MKLIALSFILLVSIGCVSALPANQDGSAAQVESPEEGLPFCYVCLVVMEKLDYLIQQNASQPEIDEILYNLCNLTTGTVRDECIKAIPWVEGQLQNGFDPQAACIKLMLCSSSSVNEAVHLNDVFAPGPGRPNFRSLKSLGSDLKQQMIRRLTGGKLSRCSGLLCTAADCELCKKVISLMDKDLFKDKDKLLAAINKLCHGLAPPADSTCLTTVDAQFPIWWDYFFQHIVTPDDICDVLKLCP
ncbi:unnamed protein product [Lymnaea stagnalis]|uniref:Saposin B-type domain-containing protein n=1 Tax=Lymnaea stagnalis TaxID=6523 RepID=A0AAV2H843_LYMST